jgi:glycosyltransferase 2 family protein
MRPEGSPMIDGTTGPESDGPAGPRAKPAARSSLAVGLAVAKRVVGGRAFKYAFVACAVGYGGYEIYRQWGDIHHALVRIGPVPALGALIVLFGMQFSNLRAWQVLLAGLGSPLRTTAVGRIYFIGQLGKYLPGSVWPILAQMELGTAYRVPRARSATTAVLAMMMGLLTGLVTALVTLPFAAHSEQYLWAFLAAPVLVACLHPKLLNPLLRFAFKLARRPGLEEPLSGRVLVHAIAWSFAAWVFNGLQIWLLAVKLGAPLGQAALLSVGGYAFAWCVGFLVIFAPAGAGIREVLLIAILAPMIGTGPATAVALVSRAVTILSDVIMAGAAAFRRPRLSQQPAETVPDLDPVTSPDR